MPLNALPNKAHSTAYPDTVLHCHLLRTSSTLMLLLALVSKNLMPNSFASAWPRLNGTARLCSSMSHLLPTRICRQNNRMCLLHAELTWCDEGCSVIQVT